MNNVMTQQDYKEMIHSIVVPANSPEEFNKCYQPLIAFLQTETPEKLYRFRQCNERSIAAFDQDQLWFSPGYKMNDDFDALLHFDKEHIKSELKAFMESEQFTKGLQSIGQSMDAFPFVQSLFSSEIIEVTRQNIAQMNQPSIDAAKKQLYNFLIGQIDTTDAIVRQVVQRSIKFACFSEEINSAAMWGYYADSGCGFALAYDFRGNGYTMCNSCMTRNLCPSNKNCLLARVIYDDVCFDATQYATWLFQQYIIQQILLDQNVLSLYKYFQDIIPCPDLFMPTKILLHKGSEWGHEHEWRLTCSCNSAEFNQQEFSCARKKPTAVYLGRKISPIHEKILRHIAVEKNIPVYKMQIRESESVYKLYPKICS